MEKREEDGPLFLGNRKSKQITFYHPSSRVNILVLIVIIQSYKTMLQNDVIKIKLNDLPGTFVWSFVVNKSTL